MMRVKFKELEFTEQYDHDGEYIGRSAEQNFGPEYWLSVVLPAGRAFYEVAILDNNNRYVQLPGIHDSKVDQDIIRNLTPNDVEGIMLKLACLHIAGVTASGLSSRWKKDPDFRAEYDALKSEFARTPRYGWGKKIVSSIVKWFSLK